MSFVNRLLSIVDHGIACGARKGEPRAYNCERCRFYCGDWVEPRYNVFDLENSDGEPTEPWACLSRTSPTPKEAERRYIEAWNKDMTPEWSHYIHGGTLSGSNRNLEVRRVTRWSSDRAHDYAKSMLAAVNPHNAEAYLRPRDPNDEPCSLAGERLTQQEQKRLSHQPVKVLEDKRCS